MGNPLQVPLLAGLADVYVDGEYILSTNIATVPTKGQMELGLGVEQAIKVARNMSYQETRYGETLVAFNELHHQIQIDRPNCLSREARIEVRERLPISGEDAKVDIQSDLVLPEWEKNSLHISSIHKIGFCLVDCFTVFQHERRLRVDQKLEDLLMQVFYTLNSLIEQLMEPSRLTEAQAKQVMSEIELIREALMAHVNWLVKESRTDNSLEVPRLPDSADDISSLEDLESLIDELLLDSSSA